MDITLFIQQSLFHNGMIHTAVDDGLTIPLQY